MHARLLEVKKGKNLGKREETFKVSCFANDIKGDVRNVSSVLLIFYTQDICAEQQTLHHL